MAGDVLNTLVSNPSVWSKTALFITHDENGGFFDHVPPPTAPAGTNCEYLTASPLPSDASGMAGPIGLGFGVPLMIVSPFARGGFVSHDTFDHTSLLRFLETLFGCGSAQFVRLAALGGGRPDERVQLRQGQRFGALAPSAVPH